MASKEQRFSTGAVPHVVRDRRSDEWYQGRAEGYREGWENGYQKGFAAGRAAGLREAQTGVKHDRP